MTIFAVQNCRLAHPRGFRFDVRNRQRGVGDGHDRLELRMLIKKGGDTGKIVKNLANPKKERRCLQRTT